MFSRSDATPEAYFQGSIICTLLGAWLGAFPIPLDWDRPWQVRKGERIDHVVNRVYHSGGLVGI